ncbi:hypothetical protein PAPYR_924 [Paratrimastix pyriformis]|uniref:Vacuolar sorting protein 39/Transforming growth factor beta receptor-associated domain-containing protein n=1 Tax=Paratrimastix pyriformis TaxID=342808 RepID=A0ABQ8UZT7_9EUKA|nr:hypothetical protein PAPYR_924 [Paratrimastix pyriformis]
MRAAFAILFLASVFAVQAVPDCSFTDSDSGVTLNFTAAAELEATQGYSLNYTDDTLGQTYHIAFCQPVESPCPTVKGSAAIVIDATGKSCFSIGKHTSMQFQSQDDGALFQIADGDKCPRTGKARMGGIIVSCDPDAGVGVIKAARKRSLEPLVGGPGAAFLFLCFARVGITTAALTLSAFTKPISLHPTRCLVWMRFKFMIGFWSALKAAKLWSFTSHHPKALQTGLAVSSDMIDTNEYGRVIAMSLMDEDRLLFLTARDPMLHLYDLKRHSYVRGFPQTRGCIAFTLGQAPSKLLPPELAPPAPVPTSYEDLSHTEPPPPPQELWLACGLERRDKTRREDRRTLGLFVWRDNDFVLVRETQISEGLKTLCVGGECVFLGYRRGYTMVHMGTLETKAIFDISDENPSLVLLPHQEVALLQHNKSFFEDFDGRASRKFRLRCQAQARGGSLQTPTTVSVLLPGGHSSGAEPPAAGPGGRAVEKAPIIHYTGQLGPVTQGSAIGGGASHSHPPLALHPCLAAGVQVALFYPYLLALHRSTVECAVVNSEVAVQLLPEERFREALADPSAQGLQFMATTERAMHRVPFEGFSFGNEVAPGASPAKGRLRFRAFVGTSKMIYEVVARPYERVTDLLVEQRYFAEGLGLCEVLNNEHFPQGKVVRLSTMRRHLGLALFKQNKFEAALGQFMKGRVDPLFVMSLYPGLLRRPGLGPKIRSAYDPTGPVTETGMPMSLLKPEGGVPCDGGGGLQVDYLANCRRVLLQQNRSAVDGYLLQSQDPTAASQAMPEQGADQQLSPTYTEDALEKLLGQRPNFFEVEDVTHSLEAEGKYRLLIGFLQGRALHDAALSILNRRRVAIEGAIQQQEQTQPGSSDPRPLRQASEPIRSPGLCLGDLVRYLQLLGNEHIDLVLSHSRKPLHDDMLLVRPARTPAPTPGHPQPRPQEVSEEREGGILLAQEQQGVYNEDMYPLMDEAEEGPAGESIVPPLPEQASAAPSPPQPRAGPSPALGARRSPQPRGLAPTPAPSPPGSRSASRILESSPAE